MPAGRPTKYREEMCELAYNYCLLGATDANLADFFDVTEDTITKWKRKHPDFLLSLKRGKEIADAKVAKSLFNRAVGYSCPDTKFATHEGQITDSQEFIKHYPPDATSAIFWLKNRNKNWSDKKEIEHSGDGISELFGNLNSQAGIHNDIGQ